VNSGFIFLICGINIFDLKMAKISDYIVGILFLILGISISVTYAYVYEQRVQYVSQTIKNSHLWVDSFDATNTQWLTTGTSPYLDAQDEPNNYVYSEVRGAGANQGDLMGDFGFEDHDTTGTINSVKLRVYGRADTSKPNQQYFTVWLWDGTSWNEVISFRGEASWTWKETDVTQYLDTWEKINQAKIRLQTEATGINGGGHACDAALLIVDYS